MRPQTTSALVAAALAISVLFLLVTTALQPHRERVPSHARTPTKTQPR